MTGKVGIRSEGFNVKKKKITMFPLQKRQPYVNNNDL
jgi:hypothetical protein